MRAAEAKMPVTLPSFVLIDSHLRRLAAMLILRLTPEDISPTSRGSNNIHSSIPIQIDRQHIRSNTGAVVNQLRHQLRTPRGFGIPHRLIPIKNSGPVGVGVEVIIQMR